MRFLEVFKKILHFELKFVGSEIFVNSMKFFVALRQEWSQSLRVGWFLALRQVRRVGRGTTALIIFIMVLTFLNLVVVSGLLVGLISGSFKQFKENYSSDIIVTAAPGRSYVENSPTLISFLTTEPQVKKFSARYGAGVTVLGTPTRPVPKNEKPNQVSARLSGIDPLQEEQLTRFSRFVIQGQPLENEGDSNSILIGASLIKKYSSFADANLPGIDLLTDVEVGDRVKVSLPQTDGTSVVKEFIVKGIVKSKVDEISTRMFITDQELKRLLPVNKDQVQEVAIAVQSGRVNEVLAAIKQVMLGSAARIQTSEEAVPSFLRDIEATMSILGNALSSFALVVASITVFIVIYINAVTKRKFIGIMKGIGISPLAIQASYFFQAFFYGVSGSAIGLALTFGFLKPYFDQNPINFPFSDGILDVTVSGAFIRVAILLFITMVAGYIPAKLIVRKNTLDSILGR